MAESAHEKGNRNYDAFISYHSGDLNLAQLVHEKLQAAGLEVWFDKARLEQGCNWYECIEQGVQASRVVLPVLTPRWRESEWTRFEAYGAESVIPLRFEGTWAEVMTPPLSRYQGTAMDLEDAGEEGWARLVGAIRTIGGRPPPRKDARIAHLRHRVNPHFVGREDALLRIHETLHHPPTAALTQGKVHAISALGGVGKTTLAREYAERFWRVYPQMLWVDASDAETGIVAEFARLAKLLFPDCVQDTDDPALAERALRALNGPEMRLLILDNAEDEASIQNWIPRQGGCRTIITSRFAAWSPTIETLRVFVLDPEPARELILRRADREPSADNVAAAERLADRLGFLPLALEQAAAYVGEQGPQYRIDDYLRLYAEAEKHLLAEHALGATEYPDSVITTWKATVAKLSPAARAVLRLCALMSAEPIPIALFVSGARIVREVMQALTGTTVSETEGGPDEYFVRNAVRDLSRYSMAAASGSAVSVHALVQAVERLDVPVDAQSALMGRGVALLTGYLPEDALEVQHWPAWEPLVPHVARLLKAARDAVPPEDQLGLMSSLGNHLLSKASYQPAEVWLRQALATSEASFGPRHQVTAACLDNLARILRDVGQFEESRRLQVRDIEIREESLGTDHPEVALSLNNLALLLQDMGRYEEAWPLLERALAISETTCGPEHPEVAACLSNLGLLLQDAGQLDRAQSRFERALELRERAYGSDHPEVAVSLNNLAVLLKDQGKLEEARPHYERALEIRERELGPDHPDVANSLNNLAMLFMRTKESERAGPLFERSLQIREKALGTEHPAVAHGLNNLAMLHSTQGRYSDALPLHERAIAVSERTLGPDHPHVAVSLFNAAKTLRAINELFEAEPLVRRAVAIVSRARFGDGQEHPYLPRFTQGYRTLLAEMGLSQDEIDRKVSEVTTGV